MESKKFISIKDALETCYLEMNNAEKELIFTKLVNEAKQMVLVLRLLLNIELN